MTYPNVRIVVVDNGSEEDDLIRLRQERERVTLLENKQNLGFSGGMNTGIRYALQDPEVAFVLVLNNDTTVEPDSLTMMMDTALRKRVDMVSPRILAYTDREAVDRLGIVVSAALLGFDMKRWEGREPFCPSGCCALYSRRVLEDIRLDDEYFDEDFFAYCEDVDLGIRAVLLGYRAALAPEAVVYHKGSVSAFAESSFSVHQVHRNTIWYLVKSVPATALVAHTLWILLTQILSIVGNLRRRRGLLVLQAKVAALRGIGKMLRKRKKLARRNVDVRSFEQALDPRPFYSLFLRRTGDYP
jgi:GT2 family glycosyltransferase